MIQMSLPTGAPDMHPDVPRQTIRFVIGDVANANGMSSYVDLLCKQVEAESGYRVSAFNKESDCYGLFQLAGPTAVGLEVNRYDWRDNIVGGVRYMAQLLHMFSGDYGKALAAFNWGPGNVRKCIAAHGAAWRSFLPAETAGYLKKIL